MGPYRKWQSKWQKRLKRKQNYETTDHATDFDIIPPTPPRSKNCTNHQDFFGKFYCLVLNHRDNSKKNQQWTAGVYTRWYSTVYTIHADINSFFMSSQGFFTQVKIYGVLSLSIILISKFMWERRACTQKSKMACYTV